MLVGMQIGVATVENMVEFPQKIENGTAIKYSKSTSGIHLKKPKTYIHPYVYRISYSSQDTEATQVPINR